MIIENDHLSKKTIIQKKKIDFLNDHCYNCGHEK